MIPLLEARLQLLQSPPLGLVRVDPLLLLAPGLGRVPGDPINDPRILPDELGEASYLSSGPRPAQRLVAELDGRVRALFVAELVEDDGFGISPELLILICRFSKLN